MAFPMTSQMRYVSGACLLLTSLTVILLTITVYSSGWTTGHYPSQHYTNTTRTYHLETNTSKSCSEGLFTICCHVKFSQTNETVISFNHVSYDDFSCFARGLSYFTGNHRAGLTVTQTLSILAWLGSLFVLGVCCVFFIRKVLSVPGMFYQMVVVYSAGLLFLIGLVVFCGCYHQFSSMQDLSLGWSLQLGAVTEACVLAEGLLVTWMYLTFRQTINYQNI